MQDSFIEDTNRKILKYLPYPGLVTRLKNYRVC